MIRALLRRLLHRTPPGCQDEDGWRYHSENIDDHVHVWPIADWITHLTEGPGANDGECKCRPVTKPIPRDDGSMGWLITHKAIDGRDQL